MAAELKPYPEMKDSGVPWLGQVPAHWDLVPAFTVFQPHLVPNLDLAEQTVLSLSYGKIVVKPPEKLRGLVPASFKTYQIVHPGDIVIRTTDLQNDRTSLRVGLASDTGVITSAYLKLRTMGLLSSEYGFRFLESWDRSKAIYRFGSGLRQGLGFDHFKRMPVSLPPEGEQQEIVSYLDGATAEVDQAIASKRRLIDLLNEQKQSIISEAVTRGLDPAVELKDSGVAWLGRIPRHWSLKPLWAIATERKQRNPGGLNLLSVFLGRGVIPYEAGGGQVHAPSLDLSGYQLVEKGDLVLNNQQAWRGSLGVAWERGIISPAYVVLALGEHLLLGFAALLFPARPLVDQFLVASKGVGDIQRQIYKPYLRNVAVPVPPIDEQDDIVSYLDEATSEIENSIALSQREIDLLEEYRTRLISDVVTGKVDVRGAAHASEAGVA